MEIIDRYVHEVGEHLPENMRADVEAELHSLLMDALEERARTASRPADPELATRVVREFGPPQEVARRYAPEAEYLIGPRLFPAYKRGMMFLVIIFASLFLASFVLSILATVQNPEKGFVPSPLFGGGVDLLKSLLFNSALITLAFAIVERVWTRQKAAGKDWDPSKLLAIASPERISLIGGVIQVYMIIVVAALFNFYPQWVGFLVVYRGISVHSILLPEFSRHLPALNVFFAAVFAYNLWMLRAGRRTPATRWGELALGLIWAGVLALMIVGPPVFRHDTLVKQGLTLWLLLTLLVSARRLYRIVARKNSLPWDGARNLIW
jgi:HAAS domain-containing protein